MKITEFKIKKNNWWLSLRSYFYDPKIISMKLDGELIYLTYYGYVILEDEKVHYTETTQEFVDVINEYIKNNY